MICRLKIGTPVETEAVTDFSEVTDRKENDILEMLGNLKCELHYGSELKSEDGAAFEFIFHMHDNTAVYGLGEANRGINKRGYIYVSDNTDEPNQTEEKRSFYGSHNFIVFKDNDEDFGLFIDHPGRVTFDVGYTHHSVCRISAEDDNLYLYLITGPSLTEIVTSFRKCIGQSYVAPSWAFGFQQSRWSYMNEDEIREVVNNYRSAGIPLDAVYLDIDYMKDYKDFTVNDETFPDFADFVQEMKEQGIHLVPIIDAGIKIEPEYFVYDEGKSKGYFCTDEESVPYGVGVWPGWTNLPDFMRPEVREWFGSLYENLTGYGLDAFWNDMNEPALFYTEKSFDDVISVLSLLSQNGDMPSADDCMRLKGMVDDANSHRHYTEFYNVVAGKRMRHDKVHNLYGYYMTRAAAEGLDKILPGHRCLLFSRSSYIGMHRYAGIWTGDNQSWWSHILLNLQMLPSLNMCGFLYCGADIGGFGSDATEELMLRWTQLGIFTPLFRNHSAQGTRRQECYRFDDVESFKQMISLRYRLLPYLYSEYLKCVSGNEMLFRPLAFDYEDDPYAANVDDQLMLGEGLMIAPVYKQAASGRTVYLPESMYLLRFTDAYDYTLEELPKGYTFVNMGLKEVCFFLKKNCILPLGCVEVCTEDLRRYNDAGRRGELVRDDFEIIGDENLHYEMWTDTDENCDPEDRNHFNISLI